MLKFPVDLLQAEKQTSKIHYIWILICLNEVTSRHLICFTVKFHKTAIIVFIIENGCMVNPIILTLV